MDKQQTYKQQPQKRQAKPSTVNDWPKHKILALFIAGIGAITTAFYLYTGSADLMQLLLITGTFIIAVGVYFFGDRV